MAKLSKSEEELIGYLWEKEKAFLKEIIACYPEPKPALTTIATLLKRMKDKGVIDYTQHGKSRQYFPLIKKKDYFSKHLSYLIRSFFNGSSTQFASFFTNEVDFSKEELEALKKEINKQIKDKK